MNVSTPSGSTALVHLVDDDESIRLATTRFLRAAGFQVRAYASAEEFLAAPASHENGCLILDLSLPGISGLDLQRLLPAWAEGLPIIFLTGRGAVTDAVTAMKAGAVDFLTKSVDGAELLEAISAAFARCADWRVERERRQAAADRYSRLTRREREVFAHLISGQLNKQVGYDLGISERTVKIHRHQVLAKMGADSVADLVRLAGDVGVQPAGAVR